MAFLSPVKNVPMESALIGALFAAMPCGVGYGFSIYSQAMKAQLGLTAGELLNVNTVSNVFGVFGSIFGAMSRQLGARWSLAVGGALMCFNLISEYLICRGDMTIGNPAISLVVLAAIGFAGQQIVTSVAFTTPVRYYKQRRGRAASLVKSFVGAAGAVVAQIFWLTVGNRSDFDKTGPDALLALLLWAGVVAIGCLIGIILIPETGSFEPDVSKESDFRLAVLFQLLLVWGICTTVLGVLNNEAWHRVIAIALIAALLFLPILLFFWSYQGPIVNSVAAAPGATFESPMSVSFPQCIRTAECWCLFIICTAVCGGGYVISNSLSDILTAAGNPSDDANVLASTLYSTGNMLGRLTCMIPSDWFVQNGYPRPFMYVIILTGMATAHALCLFLPMTDGSEALVAPAAFLGGYSFGSVWPHMIVVCSELFGTKYLADNYMFIDGGAIFIGSLGLSRALAGSVQNAHTEPGESKCIGADCFQITHIVVLAINLLGIFAAMVVVKRSVSIYRHIHAALCGEIDAKGLQESFKEPADGDEKKQDTDAA